MSQEDLAAAVMAVVIAYQISKDLLKSVRLLENCWPKPTEEAIREQSLMDALSIGEHSVSRRYRAICDEFGGAFRVGDRFSEEKLYQTAQLIDTRIATRLQQAIKFETILIDYDELTRAAVLFRRVTLGIMEQVQELLTPEELVGKFKNCSVIGHRLRPRKDSPNAEDQRGRDEDSSTCSQVAVPWTTLRTGVRLVTDTNEQTSQFQEPLLHRKAKEMGFSPAVPVNVPPVTHFQWRGADVGTMHPAIDQDTAQMSNNWFTCVDVPVMLDMSERLPKTNNPRLGTSEKWRQTDRCGSSDASSLDTRSNHDYLSISRCSSLSSAWMAVHAEPLRQGELGSTCQASLSSAGESPPQSRSSTSNDVFTPSTSPASLADKEDLEHDRDFNLASTVPHVGSRPPAIPERSPLRPLRPLQFNFVGSNHRATCHTASTEYQQSI